jgi:hypothetical protein
MRWSLSKCTFIAVIAALSACSPAAKPVKPLAIRSFQHFLVSNAQQVLPADTAYYLILSPKACAPCFGYFIQQLTKYCEHKNFYLVADDYQASQIKQYIYNKNCRYISNYLPDSLSKLAFMRGGIAFAMSADKEVQFVEVMNNTTIKKYE